MTTSNNQEKPASKNKLYLILSIVIVVFLVGGIFLWTQRASQISDGNPASYATLQINIPTVQYPTIPPSAPDFTISLHSVGSSGISGKVTFKDIAGVVAILLHLDGPIEDEEEESIIPAEIRSGTCTALGDLTYPMTAPDAGESETDLSINLKQFNAQKPVAVVLYRSPQDRTVIACGDVQ